MLLLKTEIPQQKDEMPGVVFQHDLHTEAMEGNCTSCHSKRDRAVVFKFNRIREKSTREFYHDRCIACHIRQKTAGSVSGPIAAQCRSCHGEMIMENNIRKEVVFDKSLHYAHLSSDQIKGDKEGVSGNCSRCHHQYNKSTETLLFKPGEEEACQYCHRPEITDDIRSIRQASHDSCVNCHYLFKSGNLAAGPVSCSGCHDPEAQEQTLVYSRTPRLKRGQPDTAAIGSLKMADKLRNNVMNAVAFDHLAHEEKAAGCKVCHHKKLKRCNECHAVDGSSAAGGFVSLEQAMHQHSSGRSCIGCHRKKIRSGECNGCHSMITDSTYNTRYCRTCHNLPSDSFISREPEKAAQETLNHFYALYKNVEREQIPEEVVIDTLSDIYHPVIFPHQQVISALMEHADKDDLARTFHRSQGKLCMGCHHHMQETLKPIKCVSCHSKKGTGQDGRPGLQGAFHLQCTTCHREMKIDSVKAANCIFCHKEKR